MTKLNQHQKILKALWAGRSLTPLDGLAIAGTMKLATRIGELKAMGHDIYSQWEHKKENRYKRYWMPRYVKDKRIMKTVEFYG